MAGELLKILGAIPNLPDELKRLIPRQNSPELVKPRLTELISKSGDNLPPLLDRDEPRGDVLSPVKPTQQAPANLYDAQKKAPFLETVGDGETIPVNDDLPPLRPRPITSIFKPDIVPQAPQSPTREALGLPPPSFPAGNISSDNLPPLIRPQLTELVSKTIQPRPQLTELVSKTRGQTDELPQIRPRIVGELPEVKAEKTVELLPDSDESSLPPLSRLPSDETQGKINEIIGRDFKGKDKNEKWSLGEKMAGVGWGILEGLATGGLGGAIANGIMRGTDRNAIQKIKDAQQLNRLNSQLKQQQQTEDFQTNRDYKRIQTENARNLPERERQKTLRQLKRDEQLHQRRIELLEKSQEFKSGEAKIEYDGEGRAWKTFPKNPNRPKEPILDAQGNQEVNPSEKTYETYSPITGQKIRLKGRELYSGESQQAAADASREQGVRNQNEQRRIEWQRQITANQQRRGEYDADISGNQTQIAGLQKENTDLLAERATLNQRRDAQRIATIDRQTAENAGRINVLEGQIKTWTGKRNAIKDDPEPREVEPVQQKRGGQYSGQTFESPSILRAVFPNMSDEEIRRKVEANGGKFRK